MSEGMKLSTKTEAAPILATEGTSNNSALQLLADRYAKRLARIRARAFDLKRDPTPYYTQAEAAVRALYADAT
jgi:hypothetical protein